LGSLFCLASARRTSSTALVNSCTTWNHVWTTPWVQELRREF
jgi:hypothetical protein